MKKKILALAVALCLCTSIFANTANASPIDNQSSSVNKAQQLVSCGLSQSDAEYYVEVENMFKEQKSNGEKIVIDDSIPDISDEYVASHQLEIRERILAKDKAAIKQSIKSFAKMMKNGKEMNKMMEKYRHLDKYVIKYPDGSFISVSSKIAPKAKDDGVVKPSQYYEQYKWTKTFATGNHSGTTSTTYGSTGAWANVGLYSEFNINTASKSSKMTYVRGSQNASGLLAIQAAGASISRPTNDNSTGKPAEGRNDAIIGVSGAVSLTIGNVTFSLNSGRQWTAYEYVRVYGDGVIGGYSGQNI